MKKLLVFGASVLGLLTLAPTGAKAQDFGFTISIGPGYYYQGDHCAPRRYYRPSYYPYNPYYPHYRYYYEREAYPRGYYYNQYYRRPNQCRPWQDDD